MFVTVLRETADVCYLFSQISLGDFSMFAVLLSSTWLWLPAVGRRLNEIIQTVIKRLASEISDKIKFFMVGLTPISVPESSESLVVRALHGGGHSPREHLMLDILSKRWQTLDLISMMEELNRSLCKSGSWETMLIIDKLSSRPRFKKEEDLTGCT